MEPPVFGIMEPLVCADFQAKTPSADRKPQVPPVPGAVHCAFPGIHSEPERLLQIALDIGHHPFACLAAPNVDLEVVGVANKGMTASGEFLVQVVEHDIRQHRREWAALGHALGGRCRFSVLDHPRFQVAVDEQQYLTVPGVPF